MKVLHVIQRYPPAIGGSELWCGNIARFMAEKGIVSSVATIRFYNIEEFQCPLDLDKRCIKLGHYDFDENVFIKRYNLWTLYSQRLGSRMIRALLKVPGLKNTEIGSIFRFSPHSFEMYSSLYEEIRKSDIVHLHTLPYFHNITAYFIAKRLKKKILITPYFHPLHKDYEKKIFFDIMKKCEGVFVLTDYEKAYLVKKGIDRERIHTTGCFCPKPACDIKEDFASFRERISQKYNIPKGAKKIIFIGIKLFYKGVDTLIDAAKELADEEGVDLFLLLIGPDSAEFKNRYGALKDFGRLKVIDFSVVSDEEKHNLLRFSDLLVLCSKFESFGIVFLEAWAHGKPVIGSDQGPIPEIIEGAGLCAEYGNIQDLKDKIKTVLSDKKYAGKLGENGKRKIEAQYNVENIGNKVLSVYNRLRKDRLKVLVVSQLFPPNALGGSEVVAYEQSKMLKDMGFDVRIFAGKLDDTKERFFITREKGAFDITRINLHRIDFWHNDFTNLDKKVLQERFSEVLHDIGPDIVHFHNIYGLSPKLIDEVHKLRIPMAMTLHDYWAICFKNLLLDNKNEVCKREDSKCKDCQPLHGKNNMTNSERNALVMQSLKKVDLFISPSRYLAERFIKAGLKKDKVRIINNGIDLSRFNYAKKTKSGRLRIGYMGQIIRHKGLKNLFIAFSMLSDEVAGKVSLILFGSGERPFMEYCRGLSRRLGIDRSVRFAGVVDNKKIGERLRGIDVLVVPSVWPENSPVSIMEALATGTPVLASDIGGIPELVQDGVHGYLHKYDDPVSLKNNIEKVVKNPGSLRKMKKACLEKAQRFDLLDQVRLIAEEYKDLTVNSNNRDMSDGFPKLIFDKYDIEDFIGEGWYPVENSELQKWAWSKKEAALKFPNNSIGFTLYLAGGDGLKNEICVYDPEQRLIERRELNASLIKVDIPPQVRSAKIVVSNLWKPKSDGRELGVSLRKIVPLETYNETAANLPSVVCVETTRACNMNPPCVMCSKNMRGYCDDGREMSPILIKRLAPFLKNASNLMLHGDGEPLFSKNLFVVIDLTDPKSTYSSFNTNGLLLTKENMREIVDKKISEINFSIDAANPLTYGKIRSKDNFIKVIDNIRQLAALKEERGIGYPIIAINMTLMKENIKEIPDFIMLARDIKAQIVYVKLLRPISKNFIAKRGKFTFNYKEQMLETDSPEFKEDILLAKRKAEELGIGFISVDSAVQRLIKPDKSEFLISEEGYSNKKPLCTKAWTEALIDVNGDVRICCHMEARNKEQDTVIGNLNNESLEEIWNGPLIRRFRRQFIADTFPAECWACPYHDVGKV